MTDRPILVFDSGVGGLSVATEIRRLLPALSQHYLMDSAGFPYGIKDDASLTARVLEVCTQAVATHQPRLLVVACNTRSEEHTSELQSRPHLVCRLLLEKKKK